MKTSICLWVCEVYLRRQSRELISLAWKLEEQRKKGLNVTLQPRKTQASRQNLSKWRKSYFTMCVLQIQHSQIHKQQQKWFQGKHNSDERHRHAWMVCVVKTDDAVSWICLCFCQSGCSALSSLGHHSKRSKSSRLLFNILERNVWRWNISIRLQG